MSDRAFVDTGNGIYGVYQFLPTDWVSGARLRDDDWLDIQSLEPSERIKLGLRRIAERYRIAWCAAAVSASAHGEGLRDSNRRS